MDTAHRSTDARLTVVGDELHAEMVCALLESNGINAMHRATPLANVDWGAINVGSARAREIRVLDADLVDARAVLAEQDQAAPSPAAASQDAELDAHMRRRATQLRLAFAACALLVVIGPLVLVVPGLR